MTKIFISGTESFMNKGVNALTLRVMEIISKHETNPQFTIFSVFPNIDSQLYSSYGYDLKIKKRSENWIITLIQLFNEYRQNDYIVDTNGGGFDDNAGSTYTACGKILVAYILRRKYLLFPQSYGPYNSAITRFLSKYSLNKVHAIMVRGEISRKCLLEIGVDENKIFSLPDMVYGLKPSPKQTVLEILDKENISRDLKKPIVGINLSQLINNQSKEGKYNIKYMDTMTMIIEDLIKKYHATILLIPHEIYPEERKIVVKDIIKNKGDDITAIQELMSLLESNNNTITKNIVAIKHDYKVDEIKGLIGLCDIFIGSRMHANVGAASQLIPTLSIAYSYKYNEVLLGLENYICDYRTLNPSQLIPLIDRMWSEKDNIKRELLLHQNNFKKTECDVYDKIFDNLNE